MRKQLTEAQFLDAIKGLDVGDQTLEIARGVLVEGKPQALFVERFGLSKGAVSQAVNRVFSRAQTLPPGFEQVTAILPRHRAFIVKKWAEDAKHKKDSKV
jgi:hypothetical protein